MALLLQLWMKPQQQEQEGDEALDDDDCGAKEDEDVILLAGVEEPCDEDVIDGSLSSAPHNDNDEATRKIVTFSLRPCLSSNGGGDPSKAFGVFFRGEDDEHKCTDRYTLRALADSDSEERQRAAAAARRWIERNGQRIFHTIFNLQYEPVESVRTALLFVSIHESGHHLSIVAQENFAGSATNEVLWTLRESVMWGGYTWEGGDFGSFYQDNPGSNTVMLPADAYDVTKKTASPLLRLSLSLDRDANWNPPVLEAVRRECVQLQFQDYYGNPDPVKDFEGFLISLVCLVALLYLYTRRRAHNEDEEDGDEGGDNF